MLHDVFCIRFPPVNKVLIETNWKFTAVELFKISTQSLMHTVPCLRVMKTIGYQVSYYRVVHRLFKFTIYNSKRYLDF